MPHTLGFSYEPDSGPYQFIDPRGNRFSREEALRKMNQVSQFSLHPGLAESELDALASETASKATVTVRRVSGEYRINGGVLRSEEKTTKALLLEWRRTPTQVENLIEEADSKEEWEA